MIFKGEKFGEILKREQEKEISPEQIPKEVKEVLHKLEEAGFEAYIVGGCVRDLLLGREPKDWDVTTNAKPEKIQEMFEKSFYENKFGTVTVITQSKIPSLKTIEITPYRIEGKYTDKRHPDEVKFTEKLEEDLKRRDFTVNAMAAAVQEDRVKIIDLFGGKEDLKNKIIRTVGDPKERFSEDALRLMRAIRFAVQLDFEIEENTFRAIKENSFLIEVISKERIRDELIKIIESRETKKGIELLISSNLLEKIMPEIGTRIKGEIPRFSSLEKSVKHNFNLAVRFAAFFRDIDRTVSKVERRISPEDIRRSLERLRFPKKFIEEVIDLFQNIQFLTKSEDFTEIKARYLWRKITRGEELNEEAKRKMRELLELRFSEIESENQLKQFKNLEVILDKVSKDPISRKQLEIDGREIIEILKIEPGPLVGKILEILLYEVIEDPKRNKKDYLISRVKEIGKLEEKKIEELAKLAKEKLS
jgi:tRNA nucleotidyltransferase/poly(A) polymerase